MLCVGVVIAEVRELEQVEDGASGAPSLFPRFLLRELGGGGGLETLALAFSLVEGCGMGGIGVMAGLGGGAV